MPQFVLHVGYPKTGTTYLQRTIFPQLAEQFVIVTPKFQNCGLNIRRLKHKVQQGSHVSRARQRFAGRNVIFSLEGLLFDPMRQVRSTQYAPPSWTQALEGIRFLTLDFADEEIQIVIYLRAQDELLHSIYAESKTFHFSQCPALNTLEKYAGAVMASDKLPTDPGYYYDFNNTIRYIKKYFPNSPLHVRFFEDLAGDTSGEIGFWSGICGQPLVQVAGKENARSLSVSEKRADQRNVLRHTVLRVKNRFLPWLKLPDRASRAVKKYLFKFGHGEAETIYMGDETRAQLRAKFRTVNASGIVRELIPGHLLANYFLKDQAQDKDGGAGSSTDGA